MSEEDPMMMDRPGFISKLFF